MEDKGPALITISALFTIVAFVTTLLRLWVRKRRRALGSDDYAISVAMVCTIVEAALTIKAVTRGKGKPSATLSKSDKEFINMYSWYAQHVLFVAMASVKISVCLLITRIKPAVWMKWITGIVITILVTAAFEVIVVLLAQCKPISLYWRPGPGTCWPTEVRIYSIYVQAGISIITDLLCSLLPIVVMWNVQLPLRTKLSIWILMAMGLVCTACSAVRAKSLDSKAKDIAYEYSIVAIWAMTELCLGIIATNLALSRSVYQYYFGKKYWTTENDALEYSNPSGSHSGHAHIQHPIDLDSHYLYNIKGGKRELSTSRSVDSDIPLQQTKGIEKKTEIKMHVS